MSVALVQQDEAGAPRLSSGYAPGRLRRARHDRQARCVVLMVFASIRCLAVQHILVTVRNHLELSTALGVGAFSGALCKALSFSAEKLVAIHDALPCCRTGGSATGLPTIRA